MNRISFSKFIPGIIWFFVVLFLLCMPGQDIPSNNFFEILYFDKWVHIGVFGLLALFFMLPVAYSNADQKEKFRYFVLVAISTSFWGLTSEFIQKFLISGRAFDLFDWVADSIGALAALIICWKNFGWTMKIFKPLF